MSWRPPWRTSEIVVCSTHPGEEPYRVLAVTVDELGRCASCTTVNRRPADESAELVLFDEEEVGRV